MKSLLPREPIADRIHVVHGHKRKTKCLSCGETYRDKRLKPFCGIVCRTLGQAGFGWRLYPYRIVYLESGNVLTMGPRFDLTPEGLAQLQKQAERLRQPAHEEALVISTGPMTTRTLQPQSVFLGRVLL